MKSTHLSSTKQTIRTEFIMRRPISPRPSENNLPAMFNMLAPLKLPATIAVSGPSEQKPRMQGWWRLLLVFSCIGLILYIISQDFTFVTEEKRIVRGNPSHRMITVVMNTFKRHDMMTEAINYYSQCPSVKYIYIIWSEKVPPSERILASYKETDVPRVIFNIQEIDSLNNRFKPLPEPHTDAIFSVDDDMRVPCNDLALALEVWRGSSKSLIGFMPRIHIRGPSSSLVYRCWWRVWWTGAYSIILTKAALLHHDFFHAYFQLMPVHVRELIDKKRNCEDLAMQFLIANMTSLPPIYVKGHLQDKGSLNGISTHQNVLTAGHMQERDGCLNELVTAFGNRNPLVRSHIVVDSAANRWTHTPSTWWEYISSDLWKWS